MTRMLMLERIFLPSPDSFQTVKVDLHLLWSISCVSVLLILLFSLHTLSLSTGGFAAPNALYIFSLPFLPGTCICSNRIPGCITEVKK